MPVRKESAAAKWPSAIVGEISGGSRLKVQCRIYASQRDMLRAIRRDVIGGIANSTLACCVHGTRSTIDRKDIAAVVFFSKTHLDAGTIAHEMVHAAWNVIERRCKGAKNLHKRKDLEEEQATLTGDLVTDFKKRFLL